MALFTSQIEADFVDGYYLRFNNASYPPTDTGLINSFRVYYRNTAYQIDGSFAQDQRGDYQGTATALTGFVDGVQKFAIRGMSVSLRDLDDYRGTRLNTKIFDGDDVIQGSLGKDRLLGFAGNDAIYGSTPGSGARDGADILMGNGGNDSIYGGGGNDSIVGGNDLGDVTDGADYLYGGLGNDQIYGSGGNDYLNGQAGNDLLAGGYGTDRLQGEAGADIFVMMHYSGTDTVLDFSSNDTLSIQRTNIVQDFGSAMAHAVGDANGTYISLGYGSGVILAGVNISQLDVGDFFFYG